MDAPLSLFTLFHLIQRTCSRVKDSSSDGTLGNLPRDGEETRGRDVVSFLFAAIKLNGMGNPRKKREQREQLIIHSSGKRICSPGDKLQTLQRDGRRSTFAGRDAARATIDRKAHDAAQGL